MSDIEPPARPVSLEETGLSLDFLVNLAAKKFQNTGVMTADQMAYHLKLVKPIVNTVLKEMTRLALIESRGLAGSDMTSEIRYAATAKGAEWASLATAHSAYIGPAPIPLDMFKSQMRRQSLRKEQVSAERLRDSLSDLVLPDGLLGELGPAANSSKSILLYGAPGNGKTCIAEAIAQSFSNIIYVPYALEVEGQVISFFDPTVHTPAAAEDEGKVRETAASLPAEYDPRWIPCWRPFVLTGGELTLEMLDLRFNPQSRFYEAPLHLKAAGGVFVIDDFGRQSTAPQVLINRWIIPLERGYDYITLHTGRKFAIPFDELVIFSTNIHPEDLVDEASLRRLQFKIYIDHPSEQDFVQIFHDACRKRNMAESDKLVKDVIRTVYSKMGLKFSGYHPNYILNHIQATARFENKPAELTREGIDTALRHLLIRKDG